MAWRRQVATRANGDCIERIQINLNNGGGWNAHPTRGNWAPCGTYPFVAPGGDSGVVKNKYQSMDGLISKGSPVVMAADGTRSTAPFLVRNSFPHFDPDHYRDSRDIITDKTVLDSNTDTDNSKSKIVIAVVVVAVLLYLFKDSFK